MKIEVGKVYQCKNTICRMCLNDDASVLNDNDGLLFEVIEPDGGYVDPCADGDWIVSALTGGALTSGLSVLPGHKAHMPGCCLHPIDNPDEFEITEEEVKQCEPVLL